jgi:hypothetical protein
MDLALKPMDSSSRRLIVGTAHLFGETGYCRIYILNITVILCACFLTIISAVVYNSRF